MKLPPHPRSRVLIALSALCLACTALLAAGAIAIVLWDLFTPEKHWARGITLIYVWFVLIPLGVLAAPPGLVWGLLMGRTSRPSWWATIPAGILLLGVLVPQGVALYWAFRLWCA